MSRKRLNGPSVKAEGPNGNFRQRMFDKNAGPERPGSGWPIRAWDTPYGLSRDYDGPFAERIMAGECSFEFIEEIALSNLPDANVSNLILNMKNYKEAREKWELPKEQRLKYVMEGLIDIYNGVDVPLTGLNCCFWWWGLDGSYRRENKIPESVVAEWKEKWDKEYLRKALRLPEPDDYTASISIPLDAIFNQGKDTQEREDEK